MSADKLALFEGKKYLNLTTFRKSGQAVSTPVWFVARNGRLYISTGEQTGKAKRIRANGRAQVAPGDARGNPLSEFVPARARQINNPQVKGEIEEAVRKKYGWQRQILSLLSLLGRRRTSAPVIIELELAPDSAEES